MDRADFLKLAPEYYVAAVVLDRRARSGHFSTNQIVDRYTKNANYLEHKPLLECAMRKLCEAGALTFVEDPFGDTLYQKADLFDSVHDALRLNPTTPFYKSLLAADPEDWIRRALAKLNRRYDELKLSAKDFEIEIPSEWEPIRIDQTDLLVANVIEHLEKATQAIEQDNGYAVAHPQERDQVVHDLKGGLEKFKSDAVSVGWIKKTRQALILASGRFAQTVKGQSVDGALLAIKEFVKAHVNSLLQHLWSLLP